MREEKEEDGGTGMKWIEITLNCEPNPDFNSCSDCIHADDSEEICILRKCVHAIKYLYDYYEKKER